MTDPKPTDEAMRAAVLIGDLKGLEDWARRIDAKTHLPKLLAVVEAARAYTKAIDAGASGAELFNLLRAVYDALAALDEAKRRDR